MAAETDWDRWPGFAPHVMDALEDYAWPGNVRELRNVVERAVYRWGDFLKVRLPMCNLTRSTARGGPASPSIGGVQRRRQREVLRRRRMRWRRPIWIWSMIFGRRWTPMNAPFFNTPWESIAGTSARPRERLA